MTDVEHVLEAALRLSPSARAAVAAELLESLEGLETESEDVESAWADEIQKRLAEVDSGAVKPIPWAEARRRILAAATGRRETR
jgi:putative addiction module component (TIGR02574 family)